MTHDALQIAKKIAALNAWRPAARHNWALLPQGATEPFFAVILIDPAPPAAVRLMLLRGWTPFNNFIIARHDPNFGVAMSPMELDHLELIQLRDGSVQIFDHRPGYLPLAPSPEEAQLAGRLLYECYGLLMRFEADHELALRYVGERAMFARREGPDGKWADVPLPLPTRPPVFIERVQLAKDRLALAADLPFDGGTALEVDLFLVPGFRTEEPHPRLMYLFAAVNPVDGSRIVWEKLSVNGNQNGLLALWEGLAARLLDGMITLGRVPGSVAVRSPRMMRFLRPLGLQLPFKLITHEKLPALDEAVGRAVKEKHL